MNIDRDEIKRRIVEIVQGHGGIKLMELVARLDSETIVAIKSGLSDIVEELVREGRLCEIEYMIPGQDEIGRVKSFLLPPQSRVVIRNAVLGMSGTEMRLS